MRFSESEIVEDMLEHIRQAGGEFREWRVGTVPDAQAMVLRRDAPEGSAEKLIFREAYTTYAAQEVVERLAQGFGLQLDRETIPNGAASSRPGKIVCVYRPLKVPALS